MENRRLPDLLHDKEYKDFLFDYYEFFEDAIFNAVVEFLLSQNLLSFNITDSFLHEADSEFQKKILTNSINILTKNLYNFFYEIEFMGYSVNFVLDYIYLESMDKTCRITIDESCNLVIISFIDCNICEQFNTTVKPYERMSLVDKMNNFYSSMFFDKEVADNFIQKLINNYFESEVHFINN